MVLLTSSKIDTKSENRGRLVGSCCQHLVITLKYSFGQQSGCSNL